MAKGLTTSYLHRIRKIESFCATVSARRGFGVCIKYVERVAKMYEISNVFFFLFFFFFFLDLARKLADDTDR